MIYRLTIDVQAVTGHGVTLSQATDALRQHGFTVLLAQLEYRQEANR